MLTFLKSRSKQHQNRLVLYAMRSYNLPPNSTCII